MPSAASTAVSGGCRNPQIWFLPQSRGPGLGADGFRGTWSPRQSWGQAEGRRCRAGGNSRSGHITVSAGAGGGPVGPRDLARPSPRLPLPRRLSPPPHSPHSEPSGPGSGGARGCTCVRSVCLLHVRSTWLRCKIPSTSTQASAFLLPLEMRRRHVQVFVSRNCRGVGRRWMSRWEMGADVARGTAWLWFTTGAVRSASASGRAGTANRGARGLRIGARGDARRGTRGLHVWAHGDARRGLQGLRVRAHGDSASGPAETPAASGVAEAASRRRSFLGTRSVTAGVNTVIYKTESKSRSFPHGRPWRLQEQVRRRVKTASGTLRK